MDSARFAMEVRREYQSGCGCIRDKDIAGLLEISKARVSQVLSNPFNHSSKVIQLLLSGLPSEQSRKRLFSLWLQSRHSESLPDFEVLDELRILAKQRSDAKSLEVSASDGSKSASSRANDALQAAFVRATAGEPGFSILNLAKAASLSAEAGDAQGEINAHLHRFQALFHIERIRAKEVRRVTIWIEKRIHELMLDARITSLEAQRFRLELLVANIALKLFQYLNSRLTLTHIEINKLVYKAEEISADPELPLRLRLGLLTVLVSVHAHVGDDVEASRLLDVIRKHNPHEHSLLFLDARVCRAQGRFQEASEKLIKAYELCVTRGDYLVAMFVQKELAATASDMFPGVSTSRVVG